MKTIFSLCLPPPAAAGETKIFFPAEISRDANSHALCRGGGEGGSWQCAGGGINMPDFVL